MKVSEERGLIVRAMSGQQIGSSGRSLVSYLFFCVVRVQVSLATARAGRWIASSLTGW